MSTQRLHIIHTNDLHSNFSNMKKLSTYINKIREVASDKQELVIVTDIGDHMDRMHIETEGTNGAINVEILNHLGTDIITIGNNEGLTFTKGVLEEIYSKKDFEIVVCNLKDIETNKTPSWIKEYWIQEIKNIKIGWIGATAQYETFYKLQGWIVEEPFQKIEHIVSEIKDKVDIIILLSHLGIKADEKIARTMPEIDVILGSHTHRFFEKGIKNDNQPLICQVGIFGDYVGHLIIDYNITEKKVSFLEENTISLVEYAEETKISELIQIRRNNAKNELSASVTILNTPLKTAIDSESPLANLLADGVKKWVNADIGLINSGQLLAGLDAGEVTKEQIHQICPSPINSCSLKLTGKQIIDTLEQSLLDEFIYSTIKGYGFRGEMLGMLSISGINVEYDPTYPPYQKIKRILINNKLLEEDKEYLVGTLDMFTFGGGYPLIKEGKDINYVLPEFLRDILTVQLQSKYSIEKSFEKRWIMLRSAKMYLNT